MERWLAEQVAKRSDERALDRQRGHLAQLDRDRAALMAEYRHQVANGARTAHLALEAVRSLDEEREAAHESLSDSEAQLAEWSALPTTSEAEAYYETLVDAITGKLAEADGPQALNRTLRGILAGLWVEFEEDRERLLVEFAMREPRESRLPDGQRVT